MKSISTRAMLISLIVGAALFALAGTASASHVAVEIAVPEQAEVGRPVELQVTLRSADAGQPVANTPVTVYTDASFGGVSGEVELGRGVTDENGVATVTYEPRFASEHQLRFEYLLPGDSEPEATTKSISVIDGTSQLHRSAAGIQIPGLNVWLIIALVTLVWAILFSVGLRVVAIARAGTDAEPVLERATRPRDVGPQAAAPETGASEA